MVGAIAGVAILAEPAYAVSIVDDFGFSAFSAVVDHVAKTITVTETINAPAAGFTIVFEDHTNDPELDPQGFGFNDRNFAWQVTKLIVNNSDVEWVNYDNELKVPDGSGGFMSSSNVDGTSFDQGNPSRIISSTAFSTLFVDELADRDFLRFQNGLIGFGGGDTQTFPVVSPLIDRIRLVQTPNFQNEGPGPQPGVIPEQTSLWLMGLGGLSLGLRPRRKRA